MLAMGVGNEIILATGFVQTFGAANALATAANGCSVGATKSVEFFRKVMKMVKAIR